MLKGNANRALPVPLHFLKPAIRERGVKMAVELFIAAVLGWAVHLRRLFLARKLRNIIKIKNLP
jgi:hypothetical protein